MFLSLNKLSNSFIKSVCIFSNAKAMAKEIAHCLRKNAQYAESAQRIFTIVLSGGNTAKILYPIFAEPEWKNSIPWKSVHIFFADERCVPPDYEESNYKTVCDLFINHISIPETNIHRILGEENPHKESLRYAKEIQNHLTLRKGNKNYFDWALLGVGTDGHTASLFPGQNILNSSKLCEVAQHPHTGQHRITMTPTALSLSSRITYHCIGKGKSKIVSELVSDPLAKSLYPSLRIQGEWFLDKEASAKFDF